MFNLELQYIHVGPSIGSTKDGSIFVKLHNKVGFYPVSLLFKSFVFHNNLNLKRFFVNSKYYSFNNFINKTLAEKQKYSS